MSEEEKLELDWLRWFYTNVRGELGPADCEVYDSLKEGYEERGGVLPLGYELAAEEE